MKISIITTSFNSEATIRDTLESVAKQEGGNFEHIIIDGMSTDSTLDIVSEYSHVTKVISEKDHGIYDAMNKGIQLATGDVIGFLNSDDIYANNNVITTITDVFEKENIDSVYGNLNYVSFKDISKITRKWVSAEYNRNKFLYGWMPPHPTFYVKKHIFQKYGKFNLKLKSAADYELMLRFLFKHKITSRFIDTHMVNMREGGVSNSSLSNRLRANREDKMAWKMNGLKSKFFTTYLKPFRKITQFI